MRIVVGLGNPGPQYAASRHNLGFLVVDRVSERWCISLERERIGILSGDGRVAGVRTVLIQPQTYMNRSGEVLAPLAREASISRMLVVYDDLDLPEGRLRAARNGGAGGHRGVTSIIEKLGREFDRLKVGIGRPAGEKAIPDYVLDPIAATDRARWDEVIERASDAVECWLANGVESTMNRFNAGTIASPQS